MNFWQFADAHPVWLIVWLALIVAALPSLSFSYKRGAAAESDKPKEPN